MKPAGVIAVLLLLAGCAGKNGTNPFHELPAAREAIFGQAKSAVEESLSARATAPRRTPVQVFTVLWDPQPYYAVSGYEVNYWPAAGGATNRIDVGLQCSCVLTTAQTKIFVAIRGYFQVLGYGQTYWLGYSSTVFFPGDTVVDVTGRGLQGTKSLVKPAWVNLPASYSITNPPAGDSMFFRSQDVAGPRISRREFNGY